MNRNVMYVTLRERMKFEMTGRTTEESRGRAQSGMSIQVKMVKHVWRLHALEFRLVP